MLLRILKRTIFIVSILLLHNSIILAQYGRVSVESANELFSKNDYQRSLEEYMLLLQDDTLNPFFKYRIGVCYLNLNVDRSQALPYLRDASFSDQSEPEVFFYYGVAYFHDHDFDAATDIFEHYIKNLRKQKLIPQAQRFLEMCGNARLLINQPINVKFVNLGRTINTEFADYNAFASQDDNLLVFSSNRTDGFNEIYTSKRRKFFAGWEKARQETRLNLLYDGLVAGISRDANFLFVHTTEFSSVRDIDISKRDNNAYGELDYIGNNINTYDREEGATITNEGDTLYFASDMPGGFGGLDLYMAIRLPNGQWALPKNLGAQINTQYDENYPIITDSLLFCSKGHNSMGGYDIFTSKRDPNTGQWSMPQNFGYPINNTYDNKILSMPTHNYGYITAISENDYGNATSVRDTKIEKDKGYGDLDIYKVVFRDNPLYVVYEGIIAVGDSLSPLPLKKFDTAISITVYNADTGDRYGRYDNFNRETGKYVITFIPGKFRIVVEGLSYMPYENVVTIPDVIPDNNKVKFNIYLKPK